MEIANSELQIIAYSLRSASSKHIKPILRLLDESIRNPYKSIEIHEKYRILIEDSLRAYKSDLSRLPTTKMNGKFVLDTIAEIDTILIK